MPKSHAQTLSWSFLWLLVILLVGGLEHEWMIFHILGIVTLTDELIFFRGVYHQPGYAENEGMIHFITSNKIIPATPSNPQQPIHSNLAPGHSDCLGAAARRVQWLR